MPKIKVKDIPQDQKISRQEMNRVFGGVAKVYQKYPSKSRLLVDADGDVIVKPDWWDFFYS